MMKICLLAALIAVTAAQAPVWWSAEDCGRSKYADAGEHCPIDGTCTPPAAGINVVGGMPARENEFPYQASLRTSGHFCGGVAISSKWVLTAAHCTVGDQPGDFSVFLGGHYRADSVPSEIEYEVVSVIEHPDYNSGTSDADISLLELAVEMAISDDIKPACAPNASDLYVGTSTEISGWGALDSGGVSPSQLYYTTVVVTSNAYCLTEYPGQITAGMICASDTDTHDDRDTCQGDSGGPMATKVNGQYEVIGLTSWGIGCASGYPGVYARVGEYADWVTETINQATPK